jgi:hypothetical protein
MWALWLLARRNIIPVLPDMASFVTLRGFIVGRFMSFMTATSFPYLFIIV